MADAEGTGMTAAAAPGPLAGLRVIDLTTARAELAGRVLADLGAEVIKVEPPGGVAARRLPPFASDDPDVSLYWAAVGLGKRSVVLDLEDREDRARLLALVRDADVLLESFDPGTPAALGLGHAELAAVNPGLVYVSVTPFGQDGPAAGWPASELTVEAAGGLLGLQGDGDRPPVPVGYPQAAFHAGVQAAADTVIALCERERSGFGQHLDVSTQAAMVWTLMNATGYPPNTGGDPPRTGEYRAEPPPQLVPGLTLPGILPCADGYVGATLGLGALGARSFQGLCGWMAEEDRLPADVAAINWSSWSVDVLEGRLELALVQRAVDEIAAFLLTKRKQELMARATRDRLLMAPIYTVEDLAADPQLAARSYWSVVDGRLHPGPFARLSRTPVRLGRGAPAVGEDQALLEQPRRVDQRGRASDGERRQPFAGLKVADFAWVGVGPISSKALADHGATVVHVESTTRPDILRLLPPFKDGVAGLDRSQFFANFNTSKLGLSLDLSTREGREVALRLAHWADVVVESFTPGTMQAFGLDYETLSRDRPDLVMYSTCLRGQTGPERGFGGFGGQGAALAGLWSITGWPDRPPAGPWGAYTDFIAPRYGVAALAAALLHRARTGLGQHVDLSQVEAAIHFLEPLALDYTVNGRAAGPAGHASLYASPHGVYPAAGTQRYLALSVESAAQWQGLLSVAPFSAFDRPEMAELRARQAHAAELDAAIAAWTRDQDGWELAARLRAAGVPAAVVLRPAELYQDPQLAHRGFFVTVEHTVMGPTPYDGHVTRFSATPARLARPGPCLGEHSAFVLETLLGYQSEEVAALAAAGALT
jgi:crotonobetainyl-CoA:carnitine CoA-transferase CaiB-like acyl-CoA transferase